MFHDANHAAFSSSPLVNRLAGYSGDLLGASSWVWRFKHNNLHHGNANVIGSDADIEQAPFARLAPDQPWRPWYRYQHLYIWVLYGLLTLQWLLLSDFANLVQRGVHDHRFPRPPRRRDVAALVTGKLLHVGWAVALPMLYHRWWVVLVFYVSISWVVGLLLAMIFQLAHCVEEAEFPAADAERRGAAFFVHQLRTTVDVRCRTRFGATSLSYLMGGLDHQVEHHLAPRLPHTVYPLVAARLRLACAERGLEVRQHLSPWRAIRSHARWLKAMGRRPLA